MECSILNSIKKKQITPTFQLVLDIQFDVVIYFVKQSLSYLLSLLLQMLSFALYIFRHNQRLISFRNILLFILPSLNNFVTTTGVARFVTNAMFFLLYISFEKLIRFSNDSMIPTVSHNNNSFLKYYFVNYAFVTLYSKKLLDFYVYRMQTHL